MNHHLSVHGCLVFWPLLREIILLVSDVNVLDGVVLTEVTGIV